MDLQQFFGKTVLIRLTEDGEGFVSTVRYGPLYGNSTTWMMGPAGEANREPVPDDSFYSDEE